MRDESNVLDLDTRDLLQRIAQLQKDNERLRTMLNKHGIADERGRLWIDGQPVIINPGEKYIPPPDSESTPIIQFPTPPPQGGGDQ